MKVILSMAISLNGMVAREDGAEDWLPSEGWDEFLVEAKQHDNFVMGRETYELVTKLYPDYNFDNVDVTHKIIVTSSDFRPDREGYVCVASPEEAIEYVESKGMDEVLLIGGGKLNSSFLKQNLVDEVHLTINPILLGKGRSVVALEDLEINLKLLSVKQLSLDRVRFHYAVKS